MAARQRPPRVRRASTDSAAAQVPKDRFRTRAPDSSPGRLPADRREAVEHRVAVANPISRWLVGAIGDSGKVARCGSRPVRLGVGQRCIRPFVAGHGGTPPRTREVVTEIISGGALGRATSASTAARGGMTERDDGRGCVVIPTRSAIITATRSCCPPRDWCDAARGTAREGSTISATASGAGDRSEWRWMGRGLTRARRRCVDTGSRASGRSGGTVGASCAGTAAEDPTLPGSW